MYLATWLLS